MSSKEIKIYLMRHGQTILNRAGRTQGWCDGVLTKEGIEVAVNVGFGLRDIEFKNVYSSDLGRARKTAQIIIKENIASKNLKLQEREGLREVYFGKYEAGQDKVMHDDILNYLNVSSVEEAEKKYDFQKAFCDTCAALDETKEAEDYNTAITRVMNELNQICRENADEGGNILIVAHGGIIRLIIDYLDKSFNIRNIDNSSISMISYKDGEFKVESVNDNSYGENGKEISRKNCD